MDEVRTDLGLADLATYIISFVCIRFILCGSFRGSRTLSFGVVCASILSTSFGLSCLYA